MFKPASTVLAGTVGIIVVVGLLYVGVSGPLRGSFPSSRSSLSRLPSPTPLPTISPGLPNPQRALLFIAQRQGLSEAELALVEASTVEFPLTRRAIWRGLVLNSRKAPLLYEVLIDENTKEILTGSPIDPQGYWQAEEEALRGRYADHILVLVAQRESVSAERLAITSGILEQYPLSGRTIWRGKVSDNVNAATYEIAVDVQGQPVQIENLEQAENQARQAKYGKLDPALFYFLHTRQPEEQVKVLLWMSGVDYEWVNEELARCYPQVEAYRFASGTPVDERGRPISVEPELFSRIRADYNELLDQSHRRAADPVLAFLKSRGYDAAVLDAFPGVVAELPVRVILELNQAPLASLVTISWGNVEFAPQLDSVRGTIHATAAWERGYTGQDIRIGMLDVGVVSTTVTHGTLQGKVLAANVAEPTNRHAAIVAGVMVGDHPNFPQYRGVAYGSDLLVSAKVLNSWQDVANGLNWTVDWGAFAINDSTATTGTLLERTGGGQQGQ